MGWTNVKTDWKSTDFFNISDFNRINENVISIITYTKAFKGEFSVSMNSNISSYADYYRAEHFNNIEDGISKCYEKMGMSWSKKTFYNNGVFIDATELNRIESACLTIHNKLMQLDSEVLAKSGTVYSGEVFA